MGTRPGVEVGRCKRNADQGGRVPPDLDALLTALYVLADDLLPKRSRGRGRRPRISDAEIVCLAVAQIFLDRPKERSFLRMAKRRLGHLFPYIPGQSGYNKRVRALAPQIVELVTTLARLSPSFCDRLRLLDSTPVPCAQSRETVKRPQLAGHARDAHSPPPPPPLATSGGSACPCCAPPTGCRSPSSSPPPTRPSARSRSRCSSGRSSPGR